MTHCGTGGKLASELGIKEFSTEAYDSRYTLSPSPRIPSIELTHPFPSRPFPDIELLYMHPIGGTPGKSLVAMKIKIAPNGSTPPHTHGGAFVTGHVLEGCVFNKMNDEPLRVFKAGESWFENPGCHHKVSDNFSKTEQAVVLATMVVDTHVIEKGGPMALVIIDEEFRPKQC